MTKTLAQFCKIVLLRFGLVALTATIKLAEATTVQQTSIDELVYAAEFIFEGQVTKVESRQEQDQLIYTYIRFDIIEVLKGQTEESSIELRYLGGEVNGRKLSVAEMKMPELAESGIYFVESLQNKQIHPLYGWSQGHFLINEDSTGTRKIATADRNSIEELKSSLQRPPQMVAETLTASSYANKGVAAGIVTKGSKDLTQSMHVQVFKQKILDIIADSNR